VLLTLYEGRGGRSVLVEGLPAIEALALFKPAWGWTYVGSGRSSTGVVILTCGTSDQNLSRRPAADGFIAARLVWIWKINVLLRRRRCRCGYFWWVDIGES
jgi:hypothetical protein